MEVTPERIDAARDAARRCLTAAHVTALELSHLWPEAEAGGDWRRFSANAAGVFAALRRDAETAETALDAEALDCIKLAAGILPGYPVGQWVAPTAHEGAMHAASAVYAALWVGDTVGGPASAEIWNPPSGFSRGRWEEWLLKLLTDLPDAQQRRYWAAVIEAAGRVDIPANLGAGIEAEWAAARRAIAADALAAGAQPQGQPGAGNGQDTAPTGGAQPEKPAAGKPAPKMPTEKARQAYWTRLAVGDNQTTIARKMTEHGVPANQGQVSRWLRAVDAFLAAGGIMPPLKTLHAKPEAMTPEVIEWGARQDGLTPRQRTKADPGDDWD